MIDNTIEFIVDRIKKLAKERGVSMTYLCTCIGMSKVYFVDAVRHNREIPYDKLSVLADVLRTTPEYLRGETDIKSKEKSPSISDEDIKFALFGGEGEITDEMWQAVREYAQFIKDKYGKK